MDTVELQQQEEQRFRLDRPSVRPAGHSCSANLASPTADHVTTPPDAPPAEHRAASTGNHRPT